MPLSVGRQTVIFPGFDGGAEWGGQAFDPDTGIYYVNANDLAWTGGLAPAVEATTGARPLPAELRRVPPRRSAGRAAPDRVARRHRRSEKRKLRYQRSSRRARAACPGSRTCRTRRVPRSSTILSDGTDRPAAAAPTHAPRRRSSRIASPATRKFLDPDGYPAVAPPWGTLNAINLNTGDIVWRVPLGEYPELAAKGLTNTGTENYGGPIVTAGGLVFIAATNFDRKFRAFDKATGALLWETTLPFSGNGTPATYEVDGRQYVAIAAGGGKGGARNDAGSSSGGAYVAFTLRR